MSDPEFKPTPKPSSGPGRATGTEKLGDFTTNLRVLPITLLATTIGGASAFFALALLRLIGLFTNLFYYGRWSSAMVSPAGHRLGAYSILVPIFGAIIVGMMARYGSERIRGQGIPEAIEAILINGSKVEPKVAILKPLSSAISIGSGGPFGAEGRIIMTGGAFGSMVAQLFHLTSNERKTLLVGSILAHGFTVLTLRRSILTEKVARRGYHLSREYAVDPLEILFVREVMRTNFAALPSTIPLKEVARSIRTDHRRSQRILPVVDAGGQLVGFLTRSDLRKLLQNPEEGSESRTLGELARRDPVEAYPDEPLRVVVYRMAEKGITRMPVVEGNGSRKLVGLLSLDDLLKARVRNLEEERRRETVLPLHFVFPRRVLRPDRSQED